MSADIEHPDDDQLEDYLQGRLGEDAAQGVAAHLAGCERCCQELDALSSVSDGFVEKLQAAWHFVEEHRFGPPAGSAADDRDHAALDSSVGDGSGSTIGWQRVRPAAPPLCRRVGDYELLEEIGRGGMGIVYKARQVGLDRLVAVKAIREGPFASADDVERFQAEASAAAKLRHPNIVAIHEVGEAGGQHYFSMEYVEGNSLAWKTRDNPLPASQAAHYMEIIARAIAAAHQQGIIHRDLKPSNVLIDTADQPRITDFGLAKRMAGGPDLTTTGDILGTPSYMSPEQARGGSVTPASDVYSLGAMLYELVIGRPPFRAATSVETVLQILQREPAAPRLLNAKVPTDIETICLKCLEKDPARRYASADELADELRRFSTGRPIVARPVGRASRLWRWCRRNPGVSSLAATVALLLLLVTGVSLGAAVRISAALATAELERTRAVTNLDMALEAVHKMLLEAGLQTLTTESQMTPARRRLVEQALDFYRRFENQAGNDPAMRGHMAEAHFAIGYLQLYTEEHADAERELQRSAGAFERLIAEFPRDSEYHTGRVRSWQILGILFEKIGRTTESQSAFEAAIRYCRMHPDAGTSLDIQWHLSQAQTSLAELHFQQGRYGEAEQLLDDNIADFPPFEQLDEDNDQHYSDLARALNVRGNVYARTARANLAEPDYRRALDLCKQLSDRFHIPFNLRQLTRIYLDWGSLVTRTNREAALPYYRKAVEHARTLVIRFPDVALYKRDLAAAYGGLGYHLSAARLWDEAQMAFEHADNAVSGLPVLTPRDQALLANMYNNWGNLHYHRGDRVRARQIFEKSIALATELARELPGEPYYPSMIGGTLNNIGRIEGQRGDYEAMRHLGVCAVARQLQALHIDATHPTYRTYFRNHCTVVADSLRYRHRDQEAWWWYGKAAAITAELCEDYPNASYYDDLYTGDHYNLAALMMESEDPAVRSLPAAIGILERGREYHPDFKNYWIRLGRAYYLSGEWTRALQALEQARECSEAFSSYDWFYLAMAQWRSGRHAQAVTSYRSGMDSMVPDLRADPRLAKYRLWVRARNEVQALLGDALSPPR